MDTERFSVIGVNTGSRTVKQLNRETTMQDSAYRFAIECRKTANALTGQDNVLDRVMSFIGESLGQWSQNATETERGTSGLLLSLCKLATASYSVALYNSDPIPTTETAFACVRESVLSFASSVLTEYLTGCGCGSLGCVRCYGPDGWTLPEDERGEPVTPSAYNVTRETLPAIVTRTGETVFARFGSVSFVVASSLCVTCGQDFLPGFVRCARCDWQQFTDTERTAYFRAIGFCIGCAYPLTETERTEERTLCTDCASAIMEPINATIDATLTEEATETEPLDHIASLCLDALDRERTETERDTCTCLFGCHCEIDATIERDRVQAMYPVRVFAVWVTDTASETLRGLAYTEETANALVQTLTDSGTRLYPVRAYWTEEAITI